MPNILQTTHSVLLRISIALILLAAHGAAAERDADDGHGHGHEEAEDDGEGQLPVDLQDRLPVRVQQLQDVDRLVVLRKQSRTGYCI